MGCTRVIARPRDIRGIVTRSVGSTDPIVASTVWSGPIHLAHGFTTDLGGEIRSRRNAERALRRGKLFDGHSARFEEPAEVGRQVGDRRFQKHPSARVEDGAQARQQFGIGNGGAHRAGDQERSPTRPVAIEPVWWRPKKERRRSCHRGS